MAMAPPSGSIKLDDRDVRILAILQTEGRLPIAQLAKRVHLSATPCWERLKRLEQTGVISHYAAHIDLARLAEHVQIFVVCDLETHRAADFDAFERALAVEPEILGAWALGGVYDYLMHVTTRSIATYQQLIDRLLNADIGLKRYFTYVVTKTAKAPAALPLENLGVKKAGKG